MVPSQHSAVRRALSSYSAPTGLRRRRKDVNGRLSPLALPSSHHVLPTPLFRVLSHVLPPSCPACTPLLFVLLPRTWACIHLHSFLLPLVVSSPLCYVLEATTPVAHARRILSNKTLLVELPELGKTDRGKRKSPQGRREKIWGAVFSEKRMFPFFLFLSFFLSSLLSVPRFLFRLYSLLLFPISSTASSPFASLFTVHSLFLSLSLSFSLVFNPFVLFSLQLTRLLFLFHITVPLIISLGFSFLFFRETRLILSSSSFVSFFHPTLSASSFSQVDIFCPVVSRSRRSTSL